MSSETDDEYLSDEQKEIRVLKAELSEVKQTQTSQEVSAGAKALGEHLVGFYQTYPSSPEVQKAVGDKLYNYVKGLSAQGDAGRNALRALQDRDSGPATVRALALNYMTPEQQEQAIQNRVNNRNGKLSSMATDGQPLAASQGDEMPEEFASTLEALTAAKNNPAALRELYGND